jgi:hypothetical protein
MGFGEDWWYKQDPQLKLRLVALKLPWEKKLQSDIFAATINASVEPTSFALQFGPRDVVWADRRRKQFPSRRKRSSRNLVSQNIDVVQCVAPWL